MDEVRLDPRDMKTRPCLTCESVISDAVGDKARDRREIEDEEFAHLSLPDYLETKRTYNVDT